MAYRIDALRLQNCGPIEDFSCDRFGNINLIIGENGTGKTILLKAMYSTLRTMEEYQRGNDNRTFNDILAEKLRWTFQVNKIGELVSKSADALSLNLNAENESVRYQFSRSTMKEVRATAPKKRKEGNSVYIPAKEIITLIPAIGKTRWMDRMFGFDDTYYDLANALIIPPHQGNNYAGLRKQLSDLIDGKLIYDEETGKWYYKNKKNQKFSAEATSEGVKRLLF